MQPNGDAALLNYRIVGVTRDGVPEPWHLDWHIGLMIVALRQETLFIAHDNTH